MSVKAAFARVLKIARSTGLPEITEGISYGTPSLKLRKKFLARIKDDDTLVVMCPLEEKAFLLQADDEVFFETPHYHGYPAILLRLQKAGDAAIAGRIAQAWRMQAPKKLLEQQAG